jgi:Mrp family chromosome partitioning ATPase
MARVLEALRRADTLRDERPIAARLSGVGRPKEETNTEQEPEIPFIEVGGSGPPLEASPSVLVTDAKGVAGEPGALAPGLDPKQTHTQALQPKAVTRPTAIALRRLPRVSAPLPPVAQRFAPELVAFHRPDDPLSEQFRTLATDLADQLPSEQPQVLLFTAATASTDTVTVLLNLAISRVQQQKAPVAVVDANLSQPRLAEGLGLPVFPGLCDVLAGKLSLQRAVRESGLEGLYVLTAGKTPQDMPGLLAGEAMRAILRHLRQRFEWVLVAAPHWDGRPDLVALAAGSDAVYLVVTESEAESREVEDLPEIISRQGVSVRGCVLAQLP